MIDRVANSIRERAPTIRDRALTAAATLLIVLSAVAAWRFYAEWRLGRIELTTDGPPLTVQILPEDGDEPLGEPFDMARRGVVALSDGDYRLRVTARGRLSRTYRVAVNRGETQTCPLSLEEGRLLGGERNTPLPNEERPIERPIPFVPTTVALGLTPGKADFIERTRDSLLRRDAVTGDVIWDALRPVRPFEPARDPAPWLKWLSGNSGELRVVTPAPDLNADGTADLVLAYHTKPALLALSGKDGSLLWNHTADLDSPSAARPGGQRREPNTPRRSFVAGAPAVADCDRDGTPDLIATVVVVEPAPQAKDESQSAAPAAGANPCRRIIMAVSGRTGGWLWSNALEKTFAEIPSHFWNRPRLVHGRQSAIVAVEDDTRWHSSLDPATGRTHAAARSS